MQHQQAISTALLAERVGKTIEIIVDEIDGDGAIARSAWDAPEIDGNVYLNGETGLVVGDRARVIDRSLRRIRSVGQPRRAGTAPSPEPAAPRQSNASLSSHANPLPVYPPLSAFLKHVCRFAHQAA